MITKENKRWNMRNGDSIKISILQQGGVKIGGNHIQMISSNLAAIYISLGTKHGSIEASYSGGGDACGLSLNILYNKEFTATETDDVPDTIIQFDDFINWQVFSAQISKETLAVCLIRNEPENFDTLMSVIDTKKLEPKDTAKLMTSLPGKAGKPKYKFMEAVEWKLGGITFVGAVLGIGWVGEIAYNICLFYIKDKYGQKIEDKELTNKIKNELYPDDIAVLEKELSESEEIFSFNNPKP